MAKKQKHEEEEDLEARLDAAADDAEEEEEEDTGDSGDASDEPRDGVGADASDSPAPQRVRRPVGRPRKKQPKFERRAPFISEASHLAEDGGPEAALFASKDLATIYNHVIEQVKSQQMPVESVVISVTKEGVGPMQSGIQNMAPITSDLVMGDENVSPGEALVYYITQVYHLPTSRGPKLFKCRFSYRTGTRNRIVAPVAELRLAAPEEIQAELAAKAQFAAQKAVDDAVRGVTPKRPAFPGFGSTNVYAPQYPAQQPPGAPQTNYPYPQPYPYPMPQIPQGGSPELEAMRREVAAMMGAFNERLRLEGLAPPPAPVVPAGPTAEERAAETARVVASTLVGLGFTPALAAKLNSPAVTPQSIQGAVADPLQQMEMMFGLMDRFRKMDSRLREQYEPEEEEPPKQLPAAAAVETKIEVDKTEFRPVALANKLGIPLSFGEKKEEETTLEYAFRAATHNPDAVAKMVPWLFEKFGDSAVAKLISGLIAQGLPNVAQMAQAQRAALPAAQANGASSNPVAPAAAQQTAVSSGFSAPKL